MEKKWLNISVTGERNMSTDLEQLCRLLFLRIMNVVAHLKMIGKGFYGK